MMWPTRRKNVEDDVDDQQMQASPHRRDRFWLYSKHLQARSTLESLCRVFSWLSYLV